MVEFEKFEEVEEGGMFKYYGMPGGEVTAGMECSEGCQDSLQC